MPRKVSEKVKKEIIDSFLSGLSVNDLSNNFNFSAATITRQLKNLIGLDEFKKIKLNNESKNKNSKEIKKKSDSRTVSNQFSDNPKTKNLDNEDSFSNDETNFFEIAPLIEGVDLEKQKDLASVPISEITFPKIVYLLVDEKNDLELKSLQEYPEWSFLPKADLNRNVIEIFSDKKNAQLNFKKTKKLIKVTDPNVFLIASERLKLKGISRIIFENYLIAL